MTTLFVDQPQDPTALTLLARVEALVRRRIDQAAAVVQVRRDSGGFGLVLYRRSEDYQPYVVHRYAFIDTSGATIKNGGILYEGGYYSTYEDALVDFGSRRSES